MAALQSLVRKPTSASELADRVARTKAEYEAEVARHKAAFEAQLAAHADEVTRRHESVKNRLAELEAESSVLQSLREELR